jgi:mannose-6-phosphate isomerase-like protein (cupin superfamily)
MSRHVTVRSINDVVAEPTNHGALKKVLIRHADVDSPLMFLNEVSVAPGEDLKAHSHYDMEEVFYFLEGEGVMRVEQEDYAVAPGMSFVMPARVEHYLINTGPTPMRFICFGVKERAAVKAWADS